MIGPLPKLAWAKKYLIILYLCLLTILLIILTISITCHFLQKRRQKKTADLEFLFFRMVEAYIDDFHTFLPKRLRKFSLIISTLDKMNKTISGFFWNTFKEKLIHTVLKEPLLTHLSSLKWTKRAWALKALTLSPRMTYEPYVLRFLKDKRPLVRFIASQAAVKLNTKKSIGATIEAMSKESILCQFPYHDALMHSNKLTFEHLKTLFLENKEEPIQICCLKILSEKTGWLTAQELFPTLHTTNKEIRWWSMRALANNPSEEAIHFLKNFALIGEWEFSALACHLLGTLHVLEAKDILEKNLNSQNVWVRYCAGTSLMMLGNDGRQILEAQTLEAGENACKVAKHMLSMPRVCFEKGPQDFFPKDFHDLVLTEESEEAAKKQTKPQFTSWAIKNPT